MTKIRLEVERELQALGETFQKLLTQIEARRAAAMADGAPVDYGQVEQEVAQTIGALKREAHKVVLSAQGLQAPRKEVP